LREGRETEFHLHPTVRLNVLESSFFQKICDANEDNAQSKDQFRTCGWSENLQVSQVFFRQFENIWSSISAFKEISHGQCKEMRKNAWKTNANVAKFSRYWYFSSWD